MCPDGLSLWTPGARLARSSWLPDPNGRPNPFYIELISVFAYTYQGQLLEDLGASEFLAGNWYPHRACRLRGKYAHPEWWDGGTWIGDTRSATDKEIAKQRQGYSESCAKRGERQAVPIHRSGVSRDELIAALRDCCEALHWCIGRVGGASDAYHQTMRLLDRLSR